MRVLVVCCNSEGRPCGWGLAPVEGEGGTNYLLAVTAAREEAERQYASHSCYPGEARGPVKIHDIEDEE